MLLITYSFKKNQNFELLQDFLHNEFSSNYIKHCQNFFECGRKSTEISFLFLEKEIHIFYSIPKCDEYDIILANKPCNIKEFMLKLHNMFDGDIDLSAHLSYNNIKCPKKYLFFYLPIFSFYYNKKELFSSFLLFYSFTLLRSIFHSLLKQLVQQLI